MFTNGPRKPNQRSRIGIPGDGRGVTSLFTNDNDPMDPEINVLPFLAHTCWCWQQALLQNDLCEQDTSLFLSGEFPLNTPDRLGFDRPSQQWSFTEYLVMWSGGERTENSRDTLFPRRQLLRQLCLRRKWASADYGNGIVCNIHSDRLHWNGSRAWNISVVKEYL